LQHEQVPPILYAEEQPTEAFVVSVGCPDFVFIALREADKVGLSSTPISDNTKVSS
jgi:hypothetical protein